MKNVGIITAALLALSLGMLLVIERHPSLLQKQVPAVADHSVASARPESGASGQPAQTAPPLRQSSGSKTYQSTVGTEVILPRNHSELWADLDAGEYTTVSDFSARYSDGLQFYNRGQLAWMQRYGYPMPADILAADSMSDEDLTEHANSGNSRSVAMLLDRKITQAAKLGHDLLATGLDPFAEMEFIQLTAEVSRYVQLLYASGTPFAGYMDARSTMEVFGIKTPEAEYGNIVKIALQGLAYAESNGDHLATNRALWLADEAGVDPQVFRNYVSYHGFLSSKREVLCHPGKRIQDSMPYGRDP